MFRMALAVGWTQSYITNETDAEISSHHSLTVIMVYNRNEMQMDYTSLPV